MKALPVQITRFVDASQPGWVECEFTDAAGHRHTFLEKVPILSTENLSAESTYPRPGTIACEVISTWLDATGLSLSKIDTVKPWGLESKAGATEFIVHSTLLRSYDF